MFHVADDSPRPHIPHLRLLLRQLVVVLWMLKGELVEVRALPPPEVARLEYPGKGRRGCQICQVRRRLNAEEFVKRGLRRRCILGPGNLVFGSRLRHVWIQLEQSLNGWPFSYRTSLSLHHGKPEARIPRIMQRRGSLVVFSLQESQHLGDDRGWRSC